MAIQKNILLNVSYISDVAVIKERTIEKQQTIEDAYIKVSSVNGNKTTLDFEVEVYNSEQSELIYISGYKFNPDTTDNSPNFIQQSYEYLKTLPEYADAIDC